MIIFQLREFNPIWRKCFSSWIDGRAKLPHPREFPWHIRYPGLLDAPGLPFSAILCPTHDEDKKNIKGTFSLDGSGTEKRGSFKYQGTIKVFSLSKDGIHFLNKISQNKGDFKVTELEKIFGPKPSLAEYKCSKKSGKNGAISLGNIRKGFSLGLRFSKKIKYKKNTTYYLIFKRKGNALSIAVECYSDPKRKNLMGTATIDLYTSGYPIKNIYGILPPKS